MVYVPTAWLQDSPPYINATNLNKIELALTSAQVGMYYPGSYLAAGDGVTDDTTPLSNALDDMDAAGHGVLDLGGRTYLTGKLSLKPGLTIANGALKLKNSTNDYV